jgi:hypothetical protein
MEAVDFRRQFGEAASGIRVGGAWRAAPGLWLHGAMGLQASPAYALRGSFVCSVRCTRKKRGRGCSEGCVYIGSSTKPAKFAGAPRHQPGGGER